MTRKSGIKTGLSVDMSSDESLLNYCGENNPTGVSFTFSSHVLSLSDDTGQEHKSFT